MFGDLSIVELGSYDGSLGNFSMQPCNLIENLSNLEMELGNLIQHLGNLEIDLCNLNDLMVEIGNLV